MTATLLEIRHFSPGGVNRAEARYHVGEPYSNYGAYGATLEEALGKYLLQQVMAKAVLLKDVSKVPFRILWNRRGEPYGLKQYGWYDTYRYIVPYEGQYEPNLAMLQVRQALPVQSSYAALRWRSGAQITSVDEEAMHVEVEETISLAD